uniref:CSON003269 protein n=1 Tax=Culicoides sonorensis TaxID=179676 RepID=A0A336K7L6_CULSO
MSTIYDPKSKIWIGSQNKCIFNPEIGLGEIILAVLARTPNKITQISADNGVKLTCSQLRVKSIRLAENLKRKGYKFGDIIATVSRNNHDISAVIFGCNIIGAPVNCLDPNFTVTEISDLLMITKPKLIFCEYYNLKNVQSALIEINLKSEIILTGDEVHEDMPHVTSLYEEIAGLDEKIYIPLSIPNPSQHATVILCSSGTTGKSKGVCLSHSTLISQCNEIIDATEHDFLLCFSSLYWISGMMTLLYGTLTGMTRIITTNPFSADLLSDMIEKYKVTVIVAPPSQVSQLLEHDKVDSADFSTMRYILVGGSFVSDNLRKRVKKYSKNGEVVVGYGLTEVGSLGTLTFPVNKIGSVGTLRPRMMAKVVNETGTNLGYNESGEICFKYAFPFLGYYGDEIQTRNAFDSEGWVKTGDIGYFDEENHLYILDRKKDIIKYKGYQISPSDIEETLQKVTGILNICVVGIEDFDHGTDLPAALILKNEKIKLTETDIIKIAEENLPDYKTLRGGCYFVDALPMTPSGKIQRNKVKTMAKELYQKKVLENK